MSKSYLTHHLRPHKEETNSSTWNWNIVLIKPYYKWNIFLLPRANRSGIRQFILCLLDKINEILKNEYLNCTSTYLILAGQSCVTNSGMSTQIQDHIFWIHNGVNIQAEYHRKVTLKQKEQQSVLVWVELYEKVSTNLFICFAKES